MNKLFSIIIPTRNRQIYCLESVKSILSLIDNRCEIIIQDNSDNGSLKELLDELGSDKIIYNYFSKPLSFVDNFEKALEQSTGKYFIILGDDDSITKNTISIVDWMDQNNIESLTSKYVTEYFWPNDNIEKYKTGLLSIPDYHGGLVSVDVEVGLINLIKNGFLAYQSFNLPRTYHGIVKRSCMEEVKTKGGRYFGGLTPDIYSTVALATVIKTHKVIDYPFSIAGACPASATANATIGGHSGRLEDAPHFKNRGEYTWEPSIPKYYSVETIWAESAIKALNDMKFSNWQKWFNKYKLYVYSIYLNRNYILNHSIMETIKVGKSIGTNQVNHVVHLGKHLMKYIYSKYSKNKSEIFKENETILNINSFDKCNEVLSNRLKNINPF